MSAVRRHELSVLEVVDHHLERLEKLQVTYNAATLIDGERARRRAAQLDRRLSRGEDPGPLAGAPIGIKDVINHTGRVNTAGSSFYREVARRSAPVVERLEGAGAVITARLGLHEFAFGFSSENHWFGPVRNPWDVDTSPGGSSGGSAVAVAAGLAPAAIGTDTGGSVRVPAAMCGLVGLKVTHGRVPLSGVFPLAASLDTVGPLARTVSDAALVYEAIAGYHPSDPWSVPKAVEIATARPMERLVAAVPHPWVEKAPMTKGVAAAFETGLDALRELGTDVVEVHNPLLCPPGKISELAGGEVAAVHRRWWGKETYGPEIAARLEAAMAITLDQYLEAQEWRSRVRNLAADLFRSIDLLVTPGVAALRKEIGADTITVGSEEIPYRTVLSWFSALVNDIGCPALVVPLTDTGTPPASLQLIAPWWQEARLVEVGGALERSGVAGFDWPPGVGSGVA